MVTSPSRPSVPQPRMVTYPQTECPEAESPEAAKHCHHGAGESAGASSSKRSRPASDELTGVASRATATAHLNRLLRQNRARCGDDCECFEESQIAVLFCDVDRFRVINDSLGRDAGDTLLRVVAERLRLTATQECGSDSLVARIASDEFVVVCERLTGPDAALMLAARIHSAFRESIALGEDRVKTRLSIGIALAGSSASDADALLRHAEAAAKRAKAQGTDRIETYDEHMHERAQQRLRTEMDLAGACHRGEMRLHFQPILHIGTQRVTGLEALVRWQHPTRGLVPPDEFIPLAEETGLIRQIGDWVMEEAWAQGGEWNAAGAAIRVGVNVSGRQLNQDGFVDSVVALVDRLGRGCGPHIEITESILMADPARSAAVLTELREMGVRLSLDDFGTGYSSLAYLQKFPVHILKIDRSFVENIDADQRKAALVRSMVHLGHALDMEVLGEGVETPAERRVLEDLGCDLLQGYLIARPTPPENLPLPAFL